MSCPVTRARWWGGILGSTLIVLLTGPPGCRPDAVRYVLEVRHHHYPNFCEVDTVRHEERFAIGDSNLWARVARFEPDFTIDLATREVGSRSRQMKNPAILVEVYEENRKTAELWAFRNRPPHTAGGTPLFFFLLSIEDARGIRLDVPPDSTSVAEQGEGRGS